MSQFVTCLTTAQRLIQTQQAMTDIECFETLEEAHLLRENFRFWLEGVGVSVVGVLGLGANVLTCFVLRGMKSNPSFNKLLIR